MQKRDLDQNRRQTDNSPLAESAGADSGCQSGAGQRPTYARPSLSLYIALILGIGAVLLVGLATLTAIRAEDMNRLAKEARQESAQHDLNQAVRALVADSRAILREVALWDETRKQLENPFYYQFWWRNRLMNPARIPHYVHWMEVYRANGESLSEIEETPLPRKITGAGAYASWDGYGNSLINIVPILDQRGHWPPIGYLGVRISLTLALPEVHVFDSLDPDSLSFRLPPDIKIDTRELGNYADYIAPDPTGIQLLLQAVNQNTTQLIFINLVIFAICAFTINMLVARPLRRFENLVEGLNSGEPFSGNSPSGLRIRELERLRESLLGYHAKLTQLHADLDRKNTELWQLAHVDVLTGVGNRLAFEQEWKRLVDEHSGSNRLVTFVMFDLDQLKAINDKYGHDVGDSAIKAVASSLRQALRETDQLYRLGGDEFATTLIDADQTTAEDLAARCLEAVNQIDTKEMGIKEPLKISIGLARSAAIDKATLDELPRLADDAMYRAKYSTDPKLRVYDVG